MVFFPSSFPVIMVFIAGGDRRLAQDLDRLSGISFEEMSRVQADPTRRYG